MEISKTRKESNNKGKNYLHVATLATCKIFCILGLLTHRMFCVCECLAYNVVEITPLNLFCIFIDNASRSGPREQNAFYEYLIVLYLSNNGAKESTSKRKTTPHADVFFPQLNNNNNNKEKVLILIKFSLKKIKTNKNSYQEQPTISLNTFFFF